LPPAFPLWPVFIRFPSVSEDELLLLVPLSAAIRVFMFFSAFSAALAFFA
jgi:hypothetical protein